MGNIQPPNGWPDPTGDSLLLLLSWIFAFSLSSSNEPGSKRGRRGFGRMDPGTLLGLQHEGMCPCSFVIGKACNECFGETHDGFGIFHFSRRRVAGGQGALQWKHAPCVTFFFLIFDFFFGLRAHTHPLEIGSAWHVTLLRVDPRRRPLPG